MSAVPPRMVSPDGRWEWDGVSWVPRHAAQARPLSTVWVALIVAGSIVFLLLAGAGLAAGSIAYSRAGGGLFTTQRNCLPADFPRYPGAKTVGFSGAVGPACMTQFQTADTPDEVTFFYQRTLQDYPWRIVQSNLDQGQIVFGRQDNSSASGEMTVLQSAPTTFQVLYSP